MNLPNTDVIVVLGTIVVEPRDRQALLSIIRHDISLVRAKPGCLTYAFAQDVLDESVVHMTEIWADQASLSHHLASDGFRDTMNKARALAITSRSLVVLNARALPQLPADTKQPKTE